MHVICPGLYCGLTQITNSTWSECGACPRGFRVNDDSDICNQCEEYPVSYDWLYLGFMALMPLIMHWFFIDAAAKERCFTKEQVILHMSAFLEISISGITTLLIYEPYWHLNIYSCKVVKISDWYTLFHNPSPNYEGRLHCTQEAVYPFVLMLIKSSYTKSKR